MRFFGIAVVVSMMIVIACVLPHSDTPPRFEFDVPSSMRGSTDVAIDNSSYSALCTFRMWPVGSPDPGNNWVPSGRIYSPSRTMYEVSVSLRPGVYQLLADGCSSSLDEPYHLTGTVTVGNSAMRIAIDYDRPRQARDRPEVRLILPITDRARQKMQMEEQLRNAPPPQQQPGGFDNQACVAGACDPHGTPCCAPYRCVDDPKIGNWFCVAD